MLILKKGELEKYLSDNTNNSSMRLLFYRTVTVSLILAFVSVIGSIVSTIVFQRNLDLSGISVILGILLTTAFGGKSLQSFAEKDHTK